MGRYGLSTGVPIKHSENNCFFLVGFSLKNRVRKTTTWDKLRHLSSISLDILNKIAISLTYFLRHLSSLRFSES